jgi:hypothetical protein
MMGEGGSIWTQEYQDLIYYAARDHLQSLALSVFSIGAAVQLLRLRAPALRWVATYFGISLISFAISLVAMVGATAYALTLPHDITSPQPPATGAEMLGLVAACSALPVMLGFVGFEVYSLMWWLRHAPKLPWRLGTEVLPATASLEDGV